MGKTAKNSLFLKQKWGLLDKIPKKFSKNDYEMGISLEFQSKNALWGKWKKLTIGDIVFHMKVVYLSYEGDIMFYMNLNSPMRSVYSIRGYRGYYSIHSYTTLPVCLNICQKDGIIRFILKNRKDVLLCE